MADAREPVLIGGEIAVHPAAQLFPEMGQEAFEKLKASIAQHGLRAPVVTQNNMIVDGRNRARAWLALGRPIRSLPTESIPDDVDPYTYAWDRNCERLDYDPGTKADIRVRILAESGELRRIREEAKAAADALRAAQMAGKRNAAKDPEKNSARPNERPPKPKRNKGRSAVAVAVAEQAGVSVATAERAVKKYEAEQFSKGKLPADHPLHAKRPKPQPDRKWTVEKIEALAREHLSEDEIDDLRCRLGKVRAA